MERKEQKKIKKDKGRRQVMADKMVKCGSQFWRWSSAVLFYQQVIYRQRQKYNIKMQEGLIEHCKETLKKNNLEPIKKLGKVSKTNFNNFDTQLFSVKCTSKKQFIKKPMLRRYLKQEISILQSLNHHNIVHLVRTFQDNGWIFMVMEYCDLGNIANIQTEKRDAVYSLAEASQIILDVINGLSFMHSKDIIHRDIKPENILRMRQNHKTVTKICDLGFSRQAKQEVDTFCGTTYYMAPELLQKKKYDKKVDIWALGVLIFSMLFGYVPFKAMNLEAEIISKCEHGFDLSKARIRQNLTIDSKKKNLLAELFKSIFSLDPEKRPTLEKISTYFRKFQSEPALCSTPTKYKKTIDTESSEDSSQDSVSFEIQKVNYIQSVLTEVREINYLSQVQLLALKYYFDKMCLCILQSEKSLKLSEEEKRAMEKLQDNVEKNFPLLSNSVEELNIGEFKKIFNRKIMVNFNQFKEEYRIVVGHAFHKAHKNIENAQLKIRTKLKLFCCHIINRVFEKEHRKDLFVHYFNWQEKNGRPDFFELKFFKQWIETEKLKKVNETVEIINNKFYKKCK